MFIEASEAAAVAGSPDENRTNGSNQLQKKSWGSQDPEGCRRRKPRALVAERTQGATKISRGRARLCLVIDSDRDRGRVLAAALAKLGYAVERASDGQEGRKNILANRPNLVFYDASTLRTGGIEACLELLEELLQQFPHVLPLFVLTGQHDRESDLHDGQPDKDNCSSDMIEEAALDGAVKSGCPRHRALAQGSHRSGEGLPHLVTRGRPQQRLG